MRNLPSCSCFAVMNFLRAMLDTILPPRCIKCGKVIGGTIGVCEDCFRELNFISRPYCRKCGYPFLDEHLPHNLLCPRCNAGKTSVFRYSRSALCYDEAAKPLILALKFMDKTDNAIVMARWLQQAGADIFSAGVDVLVPVPLHYTRLLKRKYNQSGLLAGELGKLTGLPVEYQALVKHRHTRPQVEFSGHERLKNIKGAFSVKHIDKLKGRKVLLIDDVMTTGATLKECALALKKAGAGSVDTLTVARVVLS